MKMKSINLTALKKHGKVYEDGKFLEETNIFLPSVYLQVFSYISLLFTLCVHSQSSLAAWFGLTLRLTSCMWQKKRNPRLNPSSRCAYNTTFDKK